MGIIGIEYTLNANNLQQIKNFCNLDVVSERNI